MKPRREICPTSGEGVHSYIFREALRCKSHGFAPEKAALLIRDRTSGCGRIVREREIDSAVRLAFQTATLRPHTHRQRGFGGGARRPTSPKPKWPQRDDARVAKFIAGGIGLADLWEASPVRIEDNDSHAEEVIDHLFPGNPLLCCGKKNYDFDTKPRESWRGELAGLQLIVPSPMSAIEGITKEGKPSKHTLTNTGRRRFLICEFDTGTTDEHAATLLHLASRAPLVLAVHSGGKSLHGWFYCADRSEEQLKLFMEYAVSLGADPATWTRSQFVRMPDGTRDNGNKQTMYFLNPEPLKHDS